jgi:homocysteine S-methyltransferase
MSKYRYALPQLDGGLFLSDGGMETTLIFHHGVDLPEFASFVLLEDEKGRAELKRYYEAYLSIARHRRLGFVLDTATWRANPDWGRRLGYDADRLRAANLAAVDLVAGLRDRWETRDTPVVLNGVIGPRGDGYRAGHLGAAEAQAYHAFQVEIFAGSSVDMVSAITVNNVNEAIGIARAAAEAGMPCVISFTVETDGRLADGASLRAAIETTDQETGGSPVYYMINCAHPTHFREAVAADEPWLHRIRGLRANASARSHAELDELDTLDAGDIDDLSRHYGKLVSSLPAVSVVGGCCGTDHRHIAAICEACVPVTTTCTAA